jgi:DNA polymerase III epsilon subunit-like protein
MTPLCFIDTETTGVHPDRRVWEVAMIRRDDDGERELLIQVSDVDLSNADPFGLKVGGFYERAFGYRKNLDEDLMARPESSVAAYVEEWTRGAHLVGAVPNFDADCLDKMLRRHLLIPAWHYHLIDVEAMAVGWLRAKGFNVEPPWGSDYLSGLCKVDPPTDEERHTALGDARWAMRWYDAMTS